MGGDNTFVFFLNDQEFRVAEPIVEGLQVRVLGRLERQADLILEGVGKQPDRVVHDTDRIDLTHGPIRFFAKPPTSFG